MWRFLIAEAIFIIDLSSLLQVNLRKSQKVISYITFASPVSHDCVSKPLTFQCSL